MTVTLRPLSLLLAGLVCGHAMGQEVGTRERLSLHGVAVRAIAEDQTPAEARLRLYLDTRPGLRFGSLTALPERAPRIGVEFKLAPNPVLAVAHGSLLRTKLSESTNLSLRVRRHGVAVVLRSEF
jgi:hypothetical protein